MKNCIYLLALLVFLVNCNSNSTGVSNDDQSDDDITEPPTQANNEAEGLGYPDDYSQWASFENRDKWGPYNLHDPSCIDNGEWTYCFSTDVMFGIPMSKVGIQVRRSKDLVNWEFRGWAFESIPQEAADFVTQVNNGEAPTNMWAPFIMKHNDNFRLYFSVSVIGSNGSYIGLATSNSLQGPWELQGAVVTTTKNDSMNAIDPSITVDQESGRHWLAYGSWFSGLYLVELSPETGKPIKPDDHGKLIARRNGPALEAPEIIYHEPTDKYYLFVSYGTLFDIYNVRVGRSENPDGPFIDINGSDLADQTDNFPILTAPYRFRDHSGWQGVGHVGIFTEGKQYFMMHQGRLGLDPNLMVMHLRKLTWTKEGWPVASPQRYADIEQSEITPDSITGTWEQIIIQPVLNATSKNESEIIDYKEEGTVTIAGEDVANWSLQNNTLMVVTQNSNNIELYTSLGYDWENGRKTIVYTGLDAEGRSVWGKKITEQ